MHVQSRDIPPTYRSRRPDIGVIPAARIEQVFTAVLYGSVALLMLLSLFGTFYGLLGRPAPLRAPWTMLGVAWGTLQVFGWALFFQALMTLAQWGARVKARRDRRWWLAYLAALAPSVYYNLQAYYDSAVGMGVPWLIAAILIVAGDIVPEVVGIRQD